MAWYEAVAWVLIAIICGLVILSIVVTVYDNEKLEKENEKLKEDLRKARQRKIKREYKKVKKVEEK